MKFKLAIASLLVLAFISGCITVKQDSIQQLITSSEELVDQAEPEVEVQKKSSIISTSGISEPFIYEIICDPKGSLEVTLKNHYSQEFALKNLPSFEVEALGLLTTRITLNGRKLFDLEKYCDKEILKSGKTVNCKISFDPNSKTSRLMVRIPTDIFLPPPKNSMGFVAPGYGHEATFICN